jgi:hypothetical protein
MASHIQRYTQNVLPSVYPNDINRSAVILSIPTNKKSEMTRRRAFKQAIGFGSILLLASVGAQLYAHQKYKERFGDNYPVNVPKALFYSSAKTLVYAAFAPFTLIHVGLRTLKVYTNGGDFDWLLPTTMPGWSAFVECNPQYERYSSVLNS